MIEIDRLTKLNHIVVHDSCSDGTASAMILKLVLPDARVTFAQYNTASQRNLVAEPGMVFADFSPDPSRAEEFLAAESIVLDHHGGPAEEVTKSFQARGLGAFASEKTEPGVCGAVLAFREVFEPLWRANRSNEDISRIVPIVRELATLSGIRDTWQRQDPRWKEACEVADAVRFWPWDRVVATPPDRWTSEILALGPIIYERHQSKVQKCIDGAYIWESPKGRKVAIFEGTKPTSDAADLMDVDLVIGLAFYVEAGTPKLIFSTRSRQRFHCQNLALAHGGGGHINAAGFSVPLHPLDPQPYELVKRILDRYEIVEEQWTAITAEPGFNERAKNREIVPKELYEGLQKHSRSAVLLEVDDGCG